MKQKKEKFRIPIIKTGNPFIPSPDDLTLFLGLPTSPRERLKLLRKIFNIDGLPSDRTLDNIHKGGIKYSTINEFEQNIIKQAPFEFADMNKFNLKEKFHCLDLTQLWRHTIYGIKVPEALHLFIAPLIKFIFQRCEEYQPQFEVIKKYNEKSKIDINHIAFDYYSPIIKSTLLTSAEQKELNNFFCKLKKGVKETKEISPEFKSAFLVFINDFWLSLFAVIDNMIINLWIKQHDEMNIESYESGFLGAVLNRDNKTFLGRFFSLLKKISCKSYAELSSYVNLPISEFERNGKTEKETKIERFKEWRSGKSVPSVEALIRYFEHDELTGAELTIYAILIRALDTIKKQELTSVYTLENYKRHYTHHKEK